MFPALPVSCVVSDTGCNVDGLLACFRLSTNPVLSIKRHASAYVTALTSLQATDARLFTLALVNHRRTRMERPFSLSAASPSSDVRRP